MDSELEQLREALQATQGRFEAYCNETPQGEPQPTTVKLNKGEVMGLFPSAPSLGVYEQVREQLIQDAVVTGPRHSA